MSDSVMNPSRTKQHKNSHTPRVFSSTIFAMLTISLTDRPPPRKSAIRFQRFAVPPGNLAIPSAVGQHASPHSAPRNRTPRSQMLQEMEQTHKCTHTHIYTNIHKTTRSSKPHKFAQAFAFVHPAKHTYTHRKPHTQDVNALNHYRDHIHIYNNKERPASGGMVTAISSPC